MTSVARRAHSASFVVPITIVSPSEVSNAPYGETIGLDDVEASFAKMHSGEVLRSVVLL